MAVIVTNHEAHLRFTSVDTTRQIDHVPAMVYRLNSDMDGPMLIKDRPNFKVPEKIYGEPNEYANMIFDDFESSDQTLGALLIGLKGSGKTLTCEQLANKMIAKGYPVLMVDASWPSYMIKAWATLCSPCMVMFDEFGKVYDEDARPGLLTLFSDTSLNRVLFAITANEHTELNEFIVNRPGRFKYSIEFENISPLARDQLFDELKLRKDLREIFTAYSTYKEVSFDILNYALRTAVKFSDTKAMYKHLGLLNIPYVPSRELVLDRIVYKGQVYNGHHQFNYTDGELVLELIDSKTNRIFVSEIFDWDTTARKDTRMDVGSGTFGSFRSTVALTSELELEIHCRFSTTPYNVMGELFNTHSMVERISEDEPAEGGEVVELGKRTA